MGDTFLPWVLQLAFSLRLSSFSVDGEHDITRKANVLASLQNLPKTHHWSIWMSAVDLKT